jgi:hypothetical protein
MLGPRFPSLPAARAMRINKKDSFANSNQRTLYLRESRGLKNACEIENLALSKRPQALCLNSPLEIAEI